MGAYLSSPVTEKVSLAEPTLASLLCCNPAEREQVKGMHMHAYVFPPMSDFSFNVCSASAGVKLALTAIWHCSQLRHAKDSNTFLV